MARGPAYPPEGYPPGGGGSYREVRRAPWSPAQAVALLAGLVLVIMGGVALARTGLNFSHIPLYRAQVIGLNYTPLSAVVQLVAGVVLLGGSAHPDTAKSTMTFFGVVLLAFGLIVAIEPVPFTNMWGYTAASGVYYAVIGGVLLVSAAVSPIFISRRQVVDRGYRGPPPPGAGRGPGGPGATWPGS